MSGTKYTPGPWSTSAPSSYRINTKEDIYFTQRWPGVGRSEELTANAHLIAAAPELYEALEEATLRM